MSTTRPPHIPNHKSTKPSLYRAGQRKQNYLHKFQAGTTTTWSGYTNFTGKSLLNSNQQTHHRSKNSIDIQPKLPTSHLFQDKHTSPYLSLMSINPDDILFKQPPRKKTVSIQQAYQIYQNHQHQIPKNIYHRQYHKNGKIHQSRSQSQSQSRSQSQSQSRSQSQSQSRSRSRSNHRHQTNELYATRHTHFNNNRHSHDNNFYRRKNSYSRSHSRSHSYDKVSMLHQSRNQLKITPPTITSTSKHKIIHGIILSDSMASKCRTFKINTPNVIHVELIAKSGYNCEKMADWMLSIEGKNKINGNSVVLFSLGTNDIAQLGVDLTLKRCEWLVEYTRRNFPCIQKIGWMALSPHWKSSRFFTGNEFTTLHQEFNNRLHLLSKKINIDIVDAQLQVEDIRIQDGLHPTLSSGRQKFENVQRRWFFQQATYLSRTTVQQQTTRTITTATTNNNNLISSQQQQRQQPITTTRQVQLNSTQPFIVNYKKTEKINFRHPCLPSRQSIKYYPHKLKHPNQLFRDSTPPENIDKDKVFLIANLYYQYRHFEEETKKWREYERVASCKETPKERTVRFANDETYNHRNNGSINREIPEIRTGPTSPRWSGNETFDSETNDESRQKTKKKRKLSDTSLSPIGFNVRTRKDTSNIEVDEDDQEQLTEHYNPLTQSTPTRHNQNQSPNSSIYTQRVIRRPSTSIEIQSPSVVSKDTHIEQLHSFDFSIIPFECKYILESLETLPEYIREQFDVLIHTTKTRQDQTVEKKIHFLEQKAYRMGKT
ncbi:unnamed protein product [Rotaria sp. Silwood1]|nr:unnamed protein product [Rotaria sp. Silwood1]